MMPTRSLPTTVTIAFIDYSPFLKKDTIQISLKSFRKQIDLVETTARNLTTLKIAYNETQMAFWEKKDNESKVTASSLVMLNALHEEHNALKDCLVAIDDFCSIFERIDNKRFSWKQGKKVVDDLGKKIELITSYVNGRNEVVDIKIG